MVQCSGCGTRNNPDARFCRQCGRMLAAPSPDEAPVTIIPGQPASKRGALLIALFALGVLAALAIGYIIGNRSSQSAPTTVQPPPVVGTPPTGSAPQISPPTPAEREAPPQPKPAASPAARPAEPPPKPAQANESPPAQPESPETRIAKLRQELAGCNQYNVFCQERARWRYCKEWWGRIPECPQAQAHTPTN
jgi:hypothetical protein